MRNIKDLIESSNVKCGKNKKRENKDSIVLAFGCAHSPVTKQGFFEFINDTYKKYKCNKIVNLGDMADFNSINFHPKNPNLPAPGDELGFIREDLKKWYEKYPKMMCCESNHTSLPYRKAMDAGIPREMMRDYNEILQAPKGWEWREEWEIDGVLYKHQGDCGGKQAALASAKNAMKSMVIAHWHGQFGVSYFANNETCIFGASAGCGVDRKAEAMAYGKHYKFKPILGCTIIKNGTIAIPVRMEL